MSNILEHTQRVEEDADGNVFVTYMNGWVREVPRYLQLAEDFAVAWQQALELAAQLNETA